MPVPKAVEEGLRMTETLDDAHVYECWQVILVLEWVEAVALDLAQGLVAVSRTLPQPVYPAACAYPTYAPGGCQPAKRYHFACR